MLMVGVLFGVLIITFVVSHVIPADPVGAILGGNAPAERVDALRHQLGLDQPLHVQFITYLGGVIRGDLGRSLRTGRPVSRDIGQFFPATLELTLTAIGLPIILGVQLRASSAVTRNRPPDHGARIFSIVGVSMPVFWTGLVLLVFFSYRLGWLPCPGRVALTGTPPPLLPDCLS